MEKYKYNISGTDPNSQMEKSTNGDTYKWRNTKYNISGTDPNFQMEKYSNGDTLKWRNTNTTFQALILTPKWRNPQMELYTNGVKSTNKQ